MLTFFSYIFVGTGIFCMVLSAIGLFRFNEDKLMKIHAIGITDVLSLPLVLIGILIKNFSFLLASKMIFLILIMFITSATSSYIAARIVYHDH